MNHDEAMQCALGYSWAWEDATRTRTASPTSAPGSLTFAEAFAAGWDAFNADERASMVPVGDAYKRWNETGGITVNRERDCEYKRTHGAHFYSLGSDERWSCNDCGDTITDEAFMTRVRKGADILSRRLGAAFGMGV